MGCRSLILVAAISLATLSRADLQLTPSLSDYEVDGFKFQQLAFQDGNKSVTYQPPRGWDYFGSGNQLTLRPPNKAKAEATISRVAPAELGSFDEETVEKLTALATAMVPKDATGVTVVSAQKNSLQISGKETFKVVLSYRSTGQAFKRSVLFLNRDRDQMRFQLVARENDFKELESAFQGSLCSWQNL